MTPEGCFGQTRHAIELPRGTQTCTTQEISSLLAGDGVSSSGTGTLQIRVFDDRFKAYRLLTPDKRVPVGSQGVKVLVSINPWPVCNRVSGIAAKIEQLSLQIRSKK
jgi:hypothetical protein